MSKYLKITLITIVIFLTFLLCRKYYALSNQQLVKYDWKSYNKHCKNDIIKIEEKDLKNIGKEWKLTYRWFDNTVFLHIKSDSCIYISK
ncbi:MAG: hypothetical protein CSA15_02890 [Candidatus Delongbacteria bacterium]|nr:MAG: hypothetical protein CSA15_02890 [Candidatus Delongbacteria bacterium]